MSKKAKIFATVFHAALCLVLCLLCFMACGDGADDKETFDMTKGELLGFQEAYDAGYLDRDDLISAAYYYNEGEYNEGFMPEGYDPAPKEPETLDEATEFAIRVAWLEIGEFEVTEINIQNARIRTYCGMYNDCIVVKFEQALYQAPDGYPVGAEPDYSITVDGIFFSGSVGYFPIIWYVTG